MNPPPIDHEGVGTLVMLAKTIDRGWRLVASSNAKTITADKFSEILGHSFFEDEGVEEVIVCRVENVQTKEVV